MQASAMRGSKDAVLNPKVHLCVQCNYPIAAYGRLEPCCHAFCLQCASSLSDCPL